ncbi:MAG: glycoside hydrolase family 3 protein [Bacteroidales bacterium]|jgi:beta-glucosidase-like glycosyl hydrolase|nr:glycoside hydrolase family 3 protein [Bacteroidales bacterium]
MRINKKHITNSIFHLLDEKTYKLCSSLICFAILFLSLQPLDEDFHKAVSAASWAEQRMKEMSLDEKIAQLIMIRANSNLSSSAQNMAVSEMSMFQYGGVCFYQGNARSQALLTNRFQEVSKIPVLIGMDAEWGVSMRLDNSIMFPRQLALGAMDSSGNRLLYEMGKEIALQCAALGVHINFAPSVDINSNSKNPAINSRSFGEIPELVTEKSYFLIKGMQDHWLSACIKHFPGHGDADQDSHYYLPVISKKRHELEDTELYPFKKLIASGVDMIMPGHLNIPALDGKEKSIASLSYDIITKLLKQEMGYDGMVITDGLEMPVLKRSTSGGVPVEVLALLAGNDILLVPENARKAIANVKKAIEEKTISEKLIDERCLRVLIFKEKKGLVEKTMVPLEGIEEKINSENAKELVEEMTAKSITLLKNKENILPITKQRKEDVVFLAIGNAQDSVLFSTLCKEYGVDYVQASRVVTEERARQLSRHLSSYSLVIIGLLGTNQSPKHNYGLHGETVNFIGQIVREKQSVLSIFGNPYIVDRLSDLEHAEALIVAYQPTQPAVRSVFKSIFGESCFEGKLPVTTLKYEALSGIASN